MDTEGRPLGPWMKLYADVIERKAYYSDRQFRALIEVYTIAARSRGVMPPVKALRAKLGPDEFDFLVAEGDLVTVDNSVTVTGWDRYQKPVDSTNAERQRRFRDRGRTVDNDSVTPRNTVTVTEAPTSTSISTSPTTTENEATVETREPGFDTDDPIDCFYLTTNRFPPEGGKLRSWIVDVASKGGHPRDFGVVFAEEYRKADHPEDVRPVLIATGDRLARMGERARKAEASEERRKANRAVFETPMMREFREAVAANYDKPQNGNGQVVRGGPLTPVGDLLGSLQRSDRSLTVDETPDRESAAAVDLGITQNGVPTFSPTEVEAINAPAEPGEPGADRDNAPDGQGQATTGR